MRKTYWLVAFAAIVLGLAVYPRASKPAEHVPTEGAHAELAHLKAQLDDESAARARDVAKLEAQLRALATALATRGAEGAAQQPTAVAELDPSLTPEPPEPQLPGEHIESVFADQPIDAAWANVAEGRIEQKLRAELPGAKLQSIECHASLCRLETVHTDQGAYGQFLSAAFKDPDKRIWLGDAFSAEPTEGAQGELVVVSYLAREGEPLPEMERR